MTLHGKICSFFLLQLLVQKSGRLPGEKLIWKPPCAGPLSNLYCVPFSPWLSVTYWKNISTGSKMWRGQRQSFADSRKLFPAAESSWGWRERGLEHQKERRALFLSTTSCLTHPCSSSSGLVDGVSNRTDVGLKAVISHCIVCRTLT